jgi:adenylate cyclase, class 2
MGQETEIKLRIMDLKALQQALKKMKATVAKGKGRVHEYNVLFDTPEGTLAKHEQMLRIRTETPEAKGAKGKKATKPEVTLTFKGPSCGNRSGQQRGGDHKVREELETEVDDAEALMKIFEGLGMHIFFRYEKYRTTFRLPAGQRWAKELKIELDETPIGIFVELEGPSEAIDRAADGLGFSKRDYITENYLVLYREECRREGKEPGDMVFANAKAARMGR